MENRYVIKRFTQEGLTLRPECLKHICAYLKEQKSANLEAVEISIDKLIDNVRVLSESEGSVILEESVIKGAIELLVRPAKEEQGQMEEEEETKNYKSKDRQIQMDNEDEYNEDGHNRGNQPHHKQMIDIVREKYLNTIVVVDAMSETPYLKVSGDRVLAENSETKMKVALGSAAEKIRVFLQRFELVRSKLQRSSKYRFGKENRTPEELEQRIEVSDIGSLIGSREQEKYVLGMTYEGLPGEYYIQDELSRVKLDITEAQIQKGYVTVSSVVIARGVYDQMKSSLHVLEFILPEYDDITNMNSIDYFGAKDKVTRILGKLISLEIESFSSAGNSQQQQNQNYHGSAKAKLSRLQRERQLELGIFDLELNSYVDLQNKDEYCVCVFSEFSLSNRNTLKKFEQVLEVYSQQLSPLIFILMGQFFTCSEVISETVNDEIKEAVSDFGVLLSKYKNLRDNCYWILMPHVNDIGGAPLQPKIELPEDVFSDLKEQVPFLKLTKNPCRLSIMGKTFLIQRNDILKDLRKNQIVLNHQKDIQMNYVETILSQRHLAPLTLLNKPVLWNYDNALQFYDNPDFLILADSYSDQFEFAIQQITEISTKRSSNHSKDIKNHTYVLNPGNFDKKSSFTLIYPLTNEIQSSSL